MAKTIQVELQAKTDKAIAEIEDLKKEIQKLQIVTGKQLNASLNDLGK